MAWQLIKKELQLQRSCLYFTVAIGLIWLILLGLCFKAEMVLIPRQLTMGQLVQYVFSLAIAPSLLIGLPLLLGAALIAEERRLGVWDWSFGLPVSRALHWIIKLSVAGVLMILISGALQKGMNVGLYALLTARGAEIEEDSYMWRFSHAMYRNVSPLGYAALCLACGAFASSFAAEPYRAFFGGGLMLAIIVSSERFADPGSALFTALKGFPDIYVHPWAHFFHRLGLAVFLWLLTLSNFRFSTPGLRRLALQVVALVTVVNITAPMVLNHEFQINLNARIKPLPELHVGLEPLILTAPLERINARGSTSNLLRYAPTLRSLYRRPHSDEVILEVGFQTKKDPYGQVLSAGIHIAELNVRTGHIRRRTRLHGRIASIQPSGRAYRVFHPNERILGVVPLFGAVNVNRPVGKLLYNLLAFGGRTPTEASPKLNLSGLERIDLGDVDTKWYSIDHKRQLYIIYRTFRADGSIMKPGETTRRNDGSRTVGYLVWRDPVADEYYVIDSSDPSPIGLFSFVASPDGRWFTRIPRMNDPRLRSRAPLEIIASDRSTTHTLSAPKGRIYVGGTGPGAGGPTPPQMGCVPHQLLPVSANGRYLPFVRTDTFKLDFQGKKRDTGFPRELEIVALDLDSGEEHILDTMAPLAETGIFIEKIKSLLWWEWVRGLPPEQTTSWITSSMVNNRNNPDRPPIVWHQGSSIPMVWAPNKNRLAVIYHRSLFIYDDLQRVGRFDLPDRRIEKMDFWTDDIILLWSDYSLWRLDLDKALNS